ncbi:uncharacterized protein LOC114307554 [Camellia sinensis]|uniref:uncharacterized protein LOC114307554 n=1 Tax=Camellia sinensis TaxID=4442 RepID=UPI001036E421|nr:uncharacterized protein LOC114307554 [Camellia sinensis]
MRLLINALCLFSLSHYSFVATKNMGSFNFLHTNLNSMSLHLLLFSLFIFNLTASGQSLLPDPVNGLLCAIVNCGQGTCVPSNATLLGFECDCYPGWKTIQIGPLTFPSCVVPNCTLDFQCGNGAPPPPPPPPPPTFNASSPCNLIWCGDGKCVVNGTGHYCQCFDGSSNLLDNPEFACFQQCYFGADCNTRFGASRSPPPPPPSNSGSPGNGPNVPANSSRKLQAVTMIVLSAIFLTCI